MASQMQNVGVSQGIGSQVITVIVYDADGAIYDLTGKTVTVSATLDTVDQFRDLACTLDADPTTGQFTFTPSAGNLTNAGIYLAQSKITNGGAVALTDKFTITVDTPV